jgi:hypothetical protein
MSMAVCGPGTDKKRKGEKHLLLTLLKAPKEITQVLSIYNH